MTRKFKRDNNIEKDALLSLSKGVPWRRAKEELMLVIKERFQNMFHFLHCTISIVSDDRKSFKVIFLDPESKLKGHKDYQELITRNNNVADGVFDKLLESKIPFVIDVDMIAAYAEPPFYAKIIQESGLKEILAIALLYESEPIGVISFFGENKGSFTPDFFPLARAIADQLSLAVKNALANEDLERKIFEREVMLELSNAIAYIKTRCELQTVIKEKIKELFPGCFPDLVQFSPETNLITPFFHEHKQTTVRSPEIETRLLQQVVGEENLVIYDLGEKEMLAINLRSSDDLLGFLLVYSENKGSFNKDAILLMRAAAYHLSSGMANILSNEAISKQEKEKSILLSFSNEVAKVRLKGDLAILVNHKLKPLCDMKNYLICVVNQDNVSHSSFLFDPNEPISRETEFQRITSMSLPVKDGHFDVVLESEFPIEFVVADLLKRETIPPVATIWSMMGLPALVGVPLRVGNKGIGVLWLDQLEATKADLLRALFAQIAVALSNILANEKIEKQLDEIRKYKEQLEEEKMYLQEQVSSGYTYSDIIGNGSEMQKVFHQLSQVSFANSTVLLLGETGTGKELVARAIHNSSPRKDRLMVKVNCAALPATLIESELFGHEKGSFTGATEKRIGKFELANHGTLFLDEIGEMPLDLQVKLLRAIQEREIERVGGKSTIKTDVRIITATNRDLQNDVEEGRFRRDLYYRLNVFPITLPPLRERTEDIPLLVSHFMEKYAKNTGSAPKHVSGKAMKEMMAYSWPGNIRELEHLLERSILTTKEQTIKELHLPVTNRRLVQGDYLKTHAENEKEHILKALAKCKGKIFGPGGAAEVLDIHVSTLNSKIRRLGIKQKRIYTK